MLQSGEQLIDKIALRQQDRAAVKGYRDAFARLAQRAGQFHGLIDHVHRRLYFERHFRSRRKNRRRTDRAAGFQPRQGFISDDTAIGQSVLGLKFHDQIVEQSVAGNQSGYIVRIEVNFLAVFGILIDDLSQHIGFERLRDGGDNLRVCRAHRCGAFSCRRQ